jgi:hypothetical protein
LAANRQALLVPDPSVAFDFSETVNRLPDLSTQWTLDGVIPLQQTGQTAEFVLVQLSSLLCRVDFCLHASFSSDVRSYAIEILKRVYDLLVVGNINTEKTRHTCPLLNLYAN